LVSCSDAGLQRGREGNLGRLSQSYVDLIISMHPDFFLFENVKGLWQTKHHREFFEELKGKLQNAGYKTTERLTNALEFGAPQDRDRILFFGVSEPLLQKQMYQDAILTTFDWERYKSHDLHKIKH
jgi:DNA (cytosine-5)-methyltransferase 1